MDREIFMRSLKIACITGLVTGSLFISNADASLGELGQHPSYRMDAEERGSQTPSIRPDVAQSDDKPVQWKHLEAQGWQVDHTNRVISLRPEISTEVLNEDQANKLLSPLRDFRPHVIAMEEAGTGVPKVPLHLIMKFCHGDDVVKGDPHAHCDQYGVNNYSVDFGDGFLKGYTGSSITFAGISGIESIGNDFLLGATALKEFDTRGLSNLTEIGNNFLENTLIENPEELKAKILDAASGQTSS